MVIDYSRGSHTYDAHPQQRSASDFTTFCDEVLADRAATKGQQYICAPMANGRRKVSALPRRWIGLDLDGCGPAEFAELLHSLSEYSALVYTTASSTPEQPRARIIVELAIPVDRASGRETSKRLLETLGSNFNWDDSCDRAEQPLFLPLHGAQHWRFTGKTLIPSMGVVMPVSAAPTVIPLPHPLACRWAEDDLAHAVGDLVRAEPGGRNNLLASITHRMGGYVAAGRLAVDVVRTQLTHSTAEWGEPDKCATTIERQLEHGKQSPLVLLVPEPDHSVIPARYTQPEGSRIRNGADLVKQQFTPTTWVIRDVLPAGITLLSGDPKAGKSFLSLQFAFAIATGCTLWNGRQPETQGRALYLALEDNDRRMQKRLTGIRMDRGLINADVSRFDYATDWPRGQSGVDEIRAYLSSNPDCRLVIIDTIAAWRNQDTSRLSAYQADYQVGEMLKPLAREFDVALLLVHHNRKQASDDAMMKISGTNGLLGSVDGALILEKPSGGNDHSTLVINGRDIDQPGELAISRTVTGFWSCLGKADEIARSAESRAVLDALRSLGGIGTIRDIQMSLDEAVKLGTLKTRLSRMNKRGEVHRNALGQYSLASFPQQELPEPPPIPDAPPPM